MVVDAPFIYRAADPVDLSENVAHLRMESKPMYFDPVVLPPSQQAKNTKLPAAQTASSAGKSAPQKQGLFAKLSAFFASMFR